MKVACSAALWMRPQRRRSGRSLGGRSDGAESRGSPAQGQGTAGPPRAGRGAKPLVGGSPPDRSNRATPAGGDSGGRRTVRLRGGRAGPFSQESLRRDRTKPDASLIYRRGKGVASSLGRYNICCPIVETSVEPQSRPTGHVFSRLAEKIPLREWGDAAGPSPPVPWIRYGKPWTRVGAYSRSKDPSGTVRDHGHKESITLRDRIGDLPGEAPIHPDWYSGSATGAEPPANRVRDTSRSPPLERSHFANKGLSTGQTGRTQELRTTRPGTAPGYPRATSRGRRVVTGLSRSDGYEVHAW